MMNQTSFVMVHPVQLAPGCSSSSSSNSSTAPSMPKFADLPSLFRESVLETSVNGVSSSSSSLLQRDTIDCNALIVGCGVAGNAAALRLANAGIKVTMIAAAQNPLNCATFYAQGGIIYKGNDDSPDLLASDVHRAGAGVCDHEAVNKMAVEGPDCVEELLLEVSKVPFTTDSNGELALTLEASHCRARILYKADHTGKAIATSMIQAVHNHPNIKLITGRSAFEIVKNENGDCIGALTVSVNDSRRIEFYRAPFTLLATGGLGDLYKNTSNPEGARGEGVGLAARAGAKLKNMQYVQFHPTTLYIPGERRFLLTEALRGEGAILRNKSGRAFAKDYDPSGELAPRDVVARLILAEMAKTNEPCMYLDISHEDSDWIKNRFPTIYQHCLERGIDMTKQPMPVVPAAHYHCGGIEVDLNGCTSLRGLYAAGEVSCTGVHGANRLASTSLLEGLVWGCAAANHFLNSSMNLVALTKEVDPLAGLHPQREANSNEIEELLASMKRIMWEKVGPIRTKRGMQEAVQEMQMLETKVAKMELDCFPSREFVGVRNAIRAAKEIAVAAAINSRSVGTHYILQDESAP